MRWSSRFAPRLPKAGRSLRRAGNWGITGCRPASRNGRDDEASHRDERAGRRAGLTALVSRVLSKSSLEDGLVTIAVIGSTAGITTIEFEPGAVADLNGVWEQLAPRNGEYKHHLQWGDDNGSSHVRAAMLGVDLDSLRQQPLRRDVQQVVLIEFDTRGRDREVVIQLIAATDYDAIST